MGQRKNFLMRAMEFGQSQELIADVSEMENSKSPYCATGNVGNTRYFLELHVSGARKIVEASFEVEDRKEKYIWLAQSAWAARTIPKKDQEELNHLLNELGDSIWDRYLQQRAEADLLPYIDDNLPEAAPAGNIPKDLKDVRSDEEFRDYVANINLSLRDKSVEALEQRIMYEVERAKNGMQTDDNKTRTRRQSILEALLKKYSSRTKPAERKALTEMLREAFDPGRGL